MAKKPKDDLFEGPARSVSGPHLTPALSPRGEGETPAVPEWVRYVAEDGARWGVQRFVELTGELPVLELAGHLTPALSPGSGEGEERASKCARLFHTLVQVNPRWWLIVRRLFGIAPMVPAPDADLDDLRVWGRTELCAQLGIEKEQLQAELDTLRGVMLMQTEKEQRGRGAEEQRGRGVEENRNGASSPSSPFPLRPSAPLPGLPFAEELLERFGFDGSMFNVKSRFERPSPDNPDQMVTVYENREERLNKMERDWFVSRLAQWRRLLEESMTSTLARNALFNELQLRRLEQEMANLSPTAPAFDGLAKRRAAIETAFKEQLDAIEERFPEFGGTSGRISFKGSVHDLILAYVEYIAFGDQRRIDRVRTAAEIEVEMRQSLQRPEPQYRLGQSLYIGEAIHGLWDPHWKSQLKPAVLAKLDRGMKEGIEKARVERGEALVDLEADGEGGEYEEAAVKT